MVYSSAYRRGLVYPGRRYRCVFTGCCGSIVFAGAFVVLSLFIVTSSNALLADGLVLTLYISMLLWQIGEWQIAGNLNSWYRMVAGPVSIPMQRWGMIIFAVLFLVETLFFLRWA